MIPNDALLVQILVEAAQHGRRLRLEQSHSSEIALITVHEGVQGVQTDDMLAMELTAVSQVQGGD